MRSLAQFSLSQPFLLGNTVLEGWSASVTLLKTSGSTEGTCNY